MIKGFRGTSLVDYPEKIAAVIYTYRCNFRCPYCYNIELVLPEYYNQLPEISEDEILEELNLRKNFIQGIVITGGEPTFWKKKLYSFIERIKGKINLPIKLDTNGSHPDLLKNLLEENLLDFVALDFKTSPFKYPEIGGSFEKIYETLDLLKDYKEKVEIRITLYPPLINLESFEEMLPFLEGFKRIALQKYLAEKTLSQAFVTPYTEEDYKKFYQRLISTYPSTQIIKRF